MCFYSVRVFKISAGSGSLFSSCVHSFAYIRRRIPNFFLFFGHRRLWTIIYYVCTRSSLHHSIQHPEWERTMARYNGRCACNLTSTMAIQWIGLIRRSLWAEVRTGEHHGTDIREVYKSFPAFNKHYSFSFASLLEKITRLHNFGYKHFSSFIYFIIVFDCRYYHYSRIRHFKNLLICTLQWTEWGNISTIPLLMYPLRYTSFICENEERDLKTTEINTNIQITLALKAAKDGDWYWKTNIVSSWIEYQQDLERDFTIFFTENQLHALRVPLAPDPKEQLGLFQTSFRYRG